MATDEEIIQDIVRVSAELGIAQLSRSEYLRRGKFSYYHLYDGGRTWEELCQAAGIDTKRIEHVSDETYFKRLVDAVTSLGRLPKSSERKKLGINFSKRRWPTLSDFIEEATRRGYLTTSESAIEREENPSITEMASPEVPAKPTSTEDNTHIVRNVPPIPLETRRHKWVRSGIEGFPYAPHDELGVVAIFGILCSNRTIDWDVIELSGGKGIDATCFDHKSGKHIRVEIKHTLSKSSWNHNIDDLDYVVCWKNRWKDFPKPVIELQDMIVPNN